MENIMSEKVSIGILAVQGAFAEHRAMLDGLGADTFLIRQKKDLEESVQNGGPQGTGGMYVRKGVHVRPLLSGGTGVQTYSKTQPEEMPTALEAGTLNGHGIAGLDAAIGYLEETGIDTIRAKEQALMKRFYEGIKEIPGVKIYGDFSSMDRCAVVSLNIRDYDSGEVSDALLTDYGISTRSGGHCAPLMHEALGTVEQGAVRFSFSHYNTEEEVDTAIRAICELAEEE